MTTGLMYFELVMVVCHGQPKIKDERKLNCVKAIFILIRTYTDFSSTYMAQKFNLIVTYP